MLLQKVNCEVYSEYKERDLVIYQNNIELKRCGLPWARIW